MKTRYRLMSRGSRGGKFYCVDTKTGKRTSLQTTNEDEAHQIIAAKNQADRQPVLNLHIAKAYLAGTDSGVAARTWQNALDALIATKHDANKERWERAAKDEAFTLIRNQVIIETQGETLLKVLKQGTVSTNIYLRRLHNFCLDMNWLAWPIVPKRQWPKLKFKEKRGVTFEEHQKILAREFNPELHAYYQLLWHFGGSQTDMASLRAEDIDWTNQTISYARMKTGSQAMIHFSDAVAKILRERPEKGFLFPQIVQWKETDRAKAFTRRCRTVAVSGISLFRRVLKDTAPVHIVDTRAQADALITSALEELQVLDACAEQGVRMTFFLFPTDDTESMMNLGRLFLYAGDRVDYVIVENPAKARGDLFKGSQLEKQLQDFGAKAIALPTVTPTTLLAVEKAEAVAGRGLSFAELSRVEAGHLERLLAGEIQWAMQKMFRQYDAVANLLLPTDFIPKEKAVAKKKAEAQPQPQLNFGE